MITEKNILNSLKHIIDPDLNADIVSLGFVKNIVIKGAHISLDIELTTPACPIKKEFQQQAEEAIARIKGVGTVKINMTSRRRSSLSDASASSLSNVRTIIAISSCKGGVGKSTLAAHIAHELSKRDCSVGIADVDIHGPSIPTLLNIKDPQIMINEQKMLLPVVKDTLKVMSFGFLLSDGPAVMRGPMVSQYVHQILHNTDWGQLDYLIIDMPPGTGDIQLTITQTIKLSGAVIVTTPQTLSLVDVSRGILMFEKVSVPILGIIDNMAYFECDGCQKRHNIFGKTGSKSLQDRFGVELLGELPMLKEFTNSVSEGSDNPIITGVVDKIIMSVQKTSLQTKTIPQVTFDAQYTSVQWPDQETQVISNRDLRLSCRCALCVDEVTGEELIKEGAISTDIAPLEITPLGNYAIGIKWNDNHASGIYPYSSIKKLEHNVNA